jgi:hypothetical protein
MVNGTVVMWTGADGEWYSRGVDWSRRGETQEFCEIR